MRSDQLLQVPAALTSPLGRMNYSLELWAGINPFSLKLLFVSVFYQRNRREVKARYTYKMENRPVRPVFGSGGLVVGDDTGKRSQGFGAR